MNSVNDAIAKAQKAAAATIDAVPAVVQAEVAPVEAMLEVNEKRSKRDRFRLTRVFDDLRRVGYEGGYDSVRRYAKRWRAARSTGVANAFVPPVFAPGEA